MRPEAPSLLYRRALRSILVGNVERSRFVALDHYLTDRRRFIVVRDSIDHYFLVLNLMITRDDIEVLHNPHFCITWRNREARMCLSKSSRKRANG